MPDEPIAQPDTVTLWPWPDARHIYLLAAGIVLGVLLGPAVMGRALPHQYELLFDAPGPTAELDAARAQLLAARQDPGAWVLSPEVAAELEQYETLAYDAMEARIETLRSLNMTPAALVEEREQSEQKILERRVARETREREQRLLQHARDVTVLELQASVARHEHRLKLIGIQMALVLALAAFAIAEALLAPPADRQGQRIASPRLAHLVTIRYALLAGWLTLAIAQPAALKQVNPYFAGVLVAVVLVVGLVPLGKRA
ncbi:hypothetical protein OT109_08020 [Phycisphaeraceae bacterium D3-23]